jgi:hypothetical protein
MMITSHKLEGMPSALDAERLRTEEIGKRSGWVSEEYKTAVETLIQHERTYAKENEHEYAQPFDLGAIWEPNDPDPLWWDERHELKVSLLPHFDDPVQLPVVFIWSGWRRFEADRIGSRRYQRRHRLWSWGLRNCLWGAEVFNSKWLQESDVKEARHLVLLTEDVTFEVLTQSWDVRRDFQRRTP